MTFIVATTSLPVDRPNANRLERRTLVPIDEEDGLWGKVQKVTNIELSHEGVT